MLFPLHRVIDQACSNNMALNQSYRGRHGDFVYTGKQNTSCIENFINVREAKNSKYTNHSTRCSRISYNHVEVTALNTSFNLYF